MIANPNIPSWMVQLGIHKARLQNIQIASQVWERMLTADDRLALGNDLSNAYCRYGSTVGIWMHARHVSFCRAIVDLAHAFGLPQHEMIWLRREIGEPFFDEANHDKPVWDPQSNTLRYRGEAVRVIKRPDLANNVILILTAFQASGWPSRIHDPLPGGRNPERLGGTVRSLNQGLQTIEFAKDGTGCGVNWRVCD